MLETIELTPKAQEQAKTILSKEKTPKEGLRVAVIGGGCSGLKYKLGFDDPKETDFVFEYSNGLKVMVDEKSALFLMGSSLEYQDGLNGSGFEVVNPNTKTTCGCGKSFS